MTAGSPTTSEKEMMEMLENSTPIAVPEFELECRASFRALRSKDFQKLLEDVQNTVASIVLDHEVFYASAAHSDNEHANTFTVTLRIRSHSWYSAELRFEELIPTALTAAQIVEHDERDTALERFMKSQNDRLVVRAGRAFSEIKDLAIS